MKVYLVIYADYDEFEVLEVWSTEEQAKNAVARFKENPVKKYCDYLDGYYYEGHEVLG